MLAPFRSGKRPRRHGDRWSHPLPDCLWKQHRGYPRAGFPMCFTEEALIQLLMDVGRCLPETGAKGFGPKDTVGFDVIEFDEGGSARARRAAYAPDAAWGERRRQHHLAQQGAQMRLWTGDIHSHPDHFVRPSAESGPGQGDLGYARMVFEQNEWMEWFLMPILTGCGSSEVTIHPWVIARDDVDRPYVASSVLVCPADEFPEREFNPVWLRGGSARPSPPPPAPVPPPAPPQQAPTLLHEHRRLHGQQRIGMLDEELSLQLRGVVSPDFHRCHVLVMGLGAASPMVESIARMQPGRLTLWDPGRVTLPDLCHTAYDVRDAIERRGRAQAMVDRLLDIAPLVELCSCDRPMDAMSGDDLDELFGGVDLVLAATGSFEHTATINAQAVARGIPAVFVGVHQHGEGGRVIGYLPGHTGCYRCASGPRYQAFADGRAEATDLARPTGSILDSQLVDLIAAKLAVGILDRGRPGRMGRFLDRVGDRTEIVVRCDPRFAFGQEIWSAALGEDAEGVQENVCYAMDSAWLANPPRTDCPVCVGEAAE